MNLVALQTLVAAGESLTLELKKSTAEKDRACRTLCALANGVRWQIFRSLSCVWHGSREPVAGMIVPGQMDRIDTPALPTAGRVCSRLW
jgi:hypothetical protein